MLTNVNKCLQILTIVNKCWQKLINVNKFWHSFNKLINVTNVNKC